MCFQDAAVDAGRSPEVVGVDNQTFHDAVLSEVIYLHLYLYHSLLPVGAKAWTVGKHSQIAGR
ncbi:MAG: hypothetical protein Kow00106_16120 [Anaerolineae bacterium]